MTDVRYICPHWGSEDKTAMAFLNDVLTEGYGGVEINLPDDKGFEESFIKGLYAVRQEHPGFIFIAQCVPPEKKESVSGHIDRVAKRLEKLAALKPDFINSHTGKDYFSFDDNCRVIEVVETIAVKSGIKILHETHRGRFSFHGPSLLPYLGQFPQMELVADYSHWCNVSESMLAGQEEVLEKIMPHVSHIHARIGHEQAPQVADPFAPEWKHHLELFTAWWRKILEYKSVNGARNFTITPEFGPAPYMPALPFTQQPIGNQWKINAKMKNYLKAQFKTS